MTTVSFGWNQNCQLGLGDEEIRVVPQVVTSLEGSSMVRIVCGSRYTVALSGEGNVYSWGRGDDFQLGHVQGASLVKVPRMIQALESVRVVNIAARGAHTMALSQQGRVYSWGRNDEGQLGQGDREPRRAPTLVPFFAGSASASAPGEEAGGVVVVRQIACGRVHSVAVSRDQRLYTWGDNDDGATGQRLAEDSVLEPRLLESVANVADVACGSRHSLVLVEESDDDGSGSGSGSGSGREGRMGNRLYAFGWGSYGQLGVGDKRVRAEPTLVRFPAPENSQHVVCITKIACGYRHSLAVLTSHAPESDEEHSTLFAWGWNQYGQLGARTPGSSFALSPVQVQAEALEASGRVVDIAGGGRHTLATVLRGSDGAKRIYAWGRNDDGQLGVGTTFSDQTQPLRVRCFGRDVRTLAAGWSHSAAILDDMRGQGPDGFGLASGALAGERGLASAATTSEQLHQDSEHGGRAYIPRSPSMQFLAERRKSMMLSRQQAGGDREGGGGGGASAAAAAWRRVTARLGSLLAYGNLDAGFAQFLNTLILLLNLLSSLRVRVGIPQDIVVGSVVPGATMTVFASNMAFGAWAELKSRRSGGEDFTALPHGINTVLFFAFIMLIMAPVFQKTGDPALAYRTGLACCFTLGVLELPCLFLVEGIRKVVPRAAMMSAMAGVSLTFIAMTFTVQIFSNPAVAIIPLVVILVCYGSNVQLPYKIPAGLLALALGTAIMWTARYFDIMLTDPASNQGLPDDGDPAALALDGDGANAPYGGLRVFVASSSVGQVWEALWDPRTWPYITVVLPLLIVNIVTNLSCLEGSEAVGDSYSVRKGLAMDAALTILGSLMGNPFPTCIYIGHGAFKSMGATGGYSYLSAVAVLALGLFNGATSIMSVVPEVAGVGILVWIGVVVTAGAFDRDDSYVQEASSTKSHAAAVALGLLPALAAWALLYIQAVIPACGTVMSAALGSEQSVPFDEVMQTLEANGVYVFGLISLSRGYLLSSIFLSSTLVEIIDRKFANAAMWMLLAAALSFFGAVHSFELDAGGITSGYGFPARTVGDFPLKYAFAYSGAAVLLLLFELRERGGTLLSLAQDAARRVLRSARKLSRRDRRADSRLSDSDLAAATAAAAAVGANKHGRGAAKGDRTSLNYTQSFDGEDDHDHGDDAADDVPLLRPKQAGGTNYATMSKQPGFHD